MENKLNEIDNIEFEEESPLEYDVIIKVRNTEIGCPEDGGRVMFTLKRKGMALFELERLTENIKKIHDLVDLEGMDYPEEKVTSYTWKEGDDYPKEVS